MSWRNKAIWTSILVVMFTASCSKSKVDKPVVSRPPLVTAPGTPEGAAVKKTIGAAGGSISSADGNFSVQIPAGALTANQEITLQPVSNQLPAGYGKAYRLTPHNIQFQQPVIIRIRYDETVITNTVPELLAVAYQNEEGKWFYIEELALDKTQKTLTVQTTHFSDWGYFPLFYLDPSEALVDPGGQLTIKCMATVDDDLFIPLPGEPEVTVPYQPDAMYFGDWHYSGAGSLQGTGNSAQYKAPNAVPQQNPEAVSVTVKMERKGQFLLVSNITIRTDLHIHYMQVDETERNAGGLNYPSRLWLYGSFGADPGAGKRSVTINGTEVLIAFWTPGMIACDIPAEGPYSSGMVEVKTSNKTTSKLLNDWLVDMYYEKVESPGGSLTKKVHLVLRFRGDAEGFIPNEGVMMVGETDLNKSSKAIINMPTGTYTNHVSMDACGDYTVTWDPIQELVVERSLNSRFEGLSARVVHQPGGFDIKIRFMAEQVLMTHRKFVDCHSGSTLDHVKDDIEIQGFHETIIPLRFGASHSKASIRMGAMPVKTGTGVAAGLYFDVVDYVPDQFTTKLYWDQADPKFD